MLFSIAPIFIGIFKKYQDRRYTYDVILRDVRATIVLVENQ